MRQLDVDFGVLVAVVALDRPLFAVLRALEDSDRMTTRDVLRKANTGWLEGHKALGRAAALGLVKRWDDVWRGHPVVFNKLTVKGERVLRVVKEAVDLHSSIVSVGFGLAQTSDKTALIQSVTS